MEGDRPSVRVAYMKNLFSELEKRGHLAGIAERDPEVICEVEKAQRAAWLPIEENVRVVRAVASLLGEERGLHLLAECVYAQFETPLWKNFIAPGVRLLGRDPAALGRWIPPAMRVIFRGCGDWSSQQTAPTRISVRLRNIPEPIAGERLWLRSLGIGMTALFMLARVDGTADLAHHDAGSWAATYTLSWKLRD